MVYPGKRSVRILFAHIGQMVSVPFFVMTSFFLLISCLAFPKLFDVFIILFRWLAIWDHYYHYYSNSRYKVIVGIRIIYDTSGNHTYIILTICYRFGIF